MMQNMIEYSKAMVKKDQTVGGERPQRLQRIQKISLLLKMIIPFFTISPS